MIKNVYFAGGCFWCIASYFYDLPGVIDVISGYCGGDEVNPTYEEVKSQTTGHRETIKIIYDDEKVKYKTLFNLFYANVDPFDEQGQFIDKGFSYTLAIYYQNQNEYEEVSQLIKEKENIVRKHVCISLESFKTFYDAEEYHQKWSQKHAEEFAKELKESGRK
ncbi:MAG: peptide-methionine (S)-S-oxide reductase MsrA [Bacilli bacterium]|nr:peptide-methionine (S)-S-oxide reductase MsrA [Bacilli bacterium]